MSKRDYYEVLGVSRTATEMRDQERVPQAGDEVSSGSQSGRQGRRREVQGSGRGLRDPRRRGKAQPLRSLRPRRRQLAAGGGAGFDPSVFTEFGDFADILGNMFGFGDLFGGGGRRGGPQRGADLRYDLEITLRGIGARRRDRRFRFRGRRPARPATASGAAPGSTPTHLPAVPRPGPGPLPAGLLHRRAHLPAVPRRRARSSPSRARPAAAPAASRASGRSPSRFPPASPPASSCGCRTKAKPAPAADPPAISTSSCTSRSTSSSGATASICSARCR